MSLDNILLKRVQELEAQGMIVLISDNGLLIVNRKANTSRMVSASTLIIVQ